ncbi:MAG: ACP S-malonyltransferase [Rickettsiales bacterium]
MKKALLFPGQGSQTVGMGKELADNFSSAREVFEEVDNALGQKLSAIIFEGPQETLTLTENAQPAIMATSIAALRVMEKEHGFGVAKEAAFVAGHSLGEYSALCAAGVLSLSDTAKLLKLRGQSMQKAVPAGQGGMAALIGADISQAEEVAKEAADGEVCSVANDNAPGQVVISGAKSAIDRAIVIAKDKGIKRALPLEVSAPFHCSLMAPAADTMKEALAGTTFNAPSVPVVANVIASAESNPDQLRDLLVQQVTGVVRWRESIAYLAGQGVTDAIEIGAGKVLSGMVKRIASDISCSNVGTPADLESFANAA